jgi:hypothetical protein
MRAHSLCADVNFVRTSLINRIKVFRRLFDGEADGIVGNGKKAICRIFSVKAGA